MLEMKITVAAPDLAAAINNLATALDRANTNRTGMTPDAAHSSTICAGVKGTQPVTPAAPVNPTTAQATPQIVRPATTQPTANPTPAPTVPTQAPGAPLSATPAQTAAQIAPTVPVVQPAPVANTAPAPTVPTSAPQYTLDMIATAGSALIDAGKMDQLMQLLGKFGVASLTELTPESYGAVAGELRALGATI